MDRVHTGCVGNGDARAGLVLPEAENLSTVVEARRAGLDRVQLARIDLGNQGDDVHFDIPGLPRGRGQPMQQLVVREGAVAGQEPANG